MSSCARSTLKSYFTRKSRHTYTDLRFEGDENLVTLLENLDGQKLFWISISGIKVTREIAPVEDLIKPSIENWIYFNESARLCKSLFMIYLFLFLKILQHEKND